MLVVPTTLSCNTAVGCCEVRRHIVTDEWPSETEESKKSELGERKIMVSEESNHLSSTESKMMKLEEDQSADRVNDIKYEPLVKGLAELPMPCDHDCTEVDDMPPLQLEEDEEIQLTYSNEKTSLTNVRECSSNLNIVLSSSPHISNENVSENYEIKPTQTNNEYQSKLETSIEESYHGFKLDANINESENHSSMVADTEKRENGTQQNFLVEELKEDRTNQKFPNSAKNNKKIVSKLKKNEEKVAKKSSRKESGSKQRKKSNDIKSSAEERNENGEKEDRNTNSDTDVSRIDKRRRSNRLKSKPDYNDKYEEEKLLMTIKTDEKTVIEGGPKNEVGQPAVSDGENISAKISSTVGDAHPFQHIFENEYFTERSFSKDAERMICDCVLTKEEILKGESGCGEDCLNRLLLIECCSRCTLGDRCSNKRFQRREYAKCEVFKTEKKGNGLKVLEDIPCGTFIMEYVGEVINSDEFERRAMEYARTKIPHFYFMSLKSDCIIDATIKGNCSRFINHSCEPNAETQKWTVQGELRIGFFSKRDIQAGEEITFDYQLQRYGKQAQRCYCETPSCSGWIGEDPDKQVDDDRRKDKKKKKQQQRDQYLDLETALDEISQIGLINRHQTLSLNRLMVHAKELPVRMQILQLIEEGHPSCRRLFVDYHGLPIIWSWMVDCTPEQDELKIQLLKTLMALPITNKTILVDSKVFSLVEQWAFVVDQKLQSEALSAQSVLESVEDIATADETPVSEMAQKVLNLWSSLREAYKIPKKERIQQMKEHEREADRNVVKPRPRRLPLYAEKIRDSYHRNRYNRHKDFEKLYYDRYKDSWKKRDSPDGSRNSDGRDYHRKSDYKDSYSINRISRLEHRQMFEMKVAREREEKELLKRKWEEEEKNYWLQQNQNLYYSGQTSSQMMTGQYIPTVPPTSYTPETNIMNSTAASLSGGLQNIQSITSTQTSSQGFFSTPSSSYISPNIVLQPHVASATPSQHSQSTTPSPMISSQINVSPQTYYQNSIPSLSSYPNNNSVSAGSYSNTNVASVSYSSNNPQSVSYPIQNIVEPISTAISQRPDPVKLDSSSYSYTQSPIASIDHSSAYSDARAYAEYDENFYTAIGADKNESYVSDYASDECRTAVATTTATAVTAASMTAASTAAVVSIDITKLKLPPKWKAARDSEGRVYYYHTKTRISQWYPPVWEEPPQTEEVEQTDPEESSEDESSAEEEEAVPVNRKRRRNHDDLEVLKRRRYRESEKQSYDQNSFDMDAEIKENLAAMSSEFQDSDNGDYSPITKDTENQNIMEAQEEESLINDAPPPAVRPLITEHIISPREPIDKHERIRNKKRIRSLKEKMKRHKRQRKLMALDESAVAAGGCNGNSGPNNISSSSSSNNLLTVPADTSSITDRKRKDAFLAKMANFVVTCLNPYFRSSCTTARITNHDDFKHLARKLTHSVMLKELKHCRSATHLTCDSSVRHKAKEYIRKYMLKFGETYVRPPDDLNYNY